ncbi:DsbA family protein [Aestuariivirga sp.]|jgi:protein-disulfide isomerase|uniref:DsbA family protein n=1 Tax=Aestuariivirga sp. TaxID=2650926 RepID=UPI0037832D66
MIRRNRLAAALAASLLAMTSLAAADDGFSEARKKEIGEIVRQYLLDNPEVLLEVSKALEAKQQAAESELRIAALTANADQVFRSANDFVAGNPEGDVTIVEFFDYNCGWCKKSFPELTKLIADDKNLRVVLKEFPIFGGDSDHAAKAALAAKKQGKYWELHSALFEHDGKVTAEVVDELAAKLGLDMTKLKADMESSEVTAALAQTHALAQTLAINGTPAFIVDQAVSPGYLPADGLASMIQDVRSQGGCKLC